MSQLIKDIFTAESFNVSFYNSNYYKKFGILIAPPFNFQPKTDLDSDTYKSYAVINQALFYVGTRMGNKISSASKNDASIPVYGRFYTGNRNKFIAGKFVKLGLSPLETPLSNFTKEAFYTSIFPSSWPYTKRKNIIMLKKFVQYKMPDSWFKQESSLNTEKNKKNAQNVIDAFTVVPTSDVVATNNNKLAINIINDNESLSAKEAKIIHSIFDI